MITKYKLTLSIDKKVVKEAKRILDYLGLKQSTFVEVLFRALIDSEVKPMGEVYGPLFERIENEMSKKKVKRKK